MPGLLYKSHWSAKVLTKIISHILCEREFFRPHPREIIYGLKFSSKFHQKRTTWKFNRNRQSIIIFVGKRSELVAGSIIMLERTFFTRKYANKLGEGIHKHCPQAKWNIQNVLNCWWKTTRAASSLWNDRALGRTRNALVMCILL